MPRPLMEQLQIVVGVKNPLVVGKCTPVTNDLPAVMKDRDLVYTEHCLDFEAHAESAPNSDSYPR